MNSTSRAATAVEDCHCLPEDCGARESFPEAAALIEIVVKFISKFVVKVNFVKKDVRSDSRTSRTNYGLQTYIKALVDIRQRTQVRVRFSRTASLKRGQKDHFRAFGVKEG